MESESITKFYVGMYDETMEFQIVHPEEILDFCKDIFEGFTLYESKGGWDGETEDGMVVEVVGLSEAEAEDLKTEFEIEFDQDTVMVVRSQAEVLM